MTIDKNHCNVCQKEFGLMGSGFGGKCTLCGAYACAEHFLAHKQLCKACAVKHGIKED
ncbi:MAG: hypothetical protein HY825_15740 [Acidobacteria bacterium]|nr:hypothetical protein [Acidobacteriota bacterium]